MADKELAKRMVIHQVFPDDSGKIYCRKRHATLKPDQAPCDDCELLAGSAQGYGVECLYEDVVDKHIRMPYRNSTNSELLRISQLIDEGLVTKKPVRRDE